MPEYLYPGVYVEEIDAGVKPIPGVSTSIDREALESIAAEFRRTMRTHAPGWTDPGDSDPGVTLVEVFAFLAESLLHHSEFVERSRAAALRAAAALTAHGQASRPGRGALRRPLFYSGRLLDAATLAAEQDYLREKQRRHNRELHGHGVVSGLAVRLECTTDPGRSRVIVEPGYAIDGNGEEISVPGGATLAAPAHGDRAFVTLRFWEHVCPPSPTAESAPSDLPSIEEACIVAISPDVVAPACALARLVRSEGSWQVDPAFVTPRVTQKGS
jgi:hypothetical protein